MALCVHMSGYGSQKVRGDLRVDGSVLLVKNLLKWMLFDPTRETKEGWLLLIVETEANWNSRSTYERGPSLAGSLGSSCRNMRFCPALAALVGPVKKILFPPCTLLNFICPQRPNKLDRQSCRVAYLLVCVSVPYPLSTMSGMGTCMVTDNIFSSWRGFQ